MKRNKRVLSLLLGLILVFGLMGCNADNTNKVDPDKDIVQAPEDDIMDENVEDSDDAVEEPVDENLDPMDSMIDSSDYISKIKLINKGSNKEIKILDNIKGNLSHNDLPIIKNLEMNRAYVVFLKNVDDNVVLTDATNGVILLEGDNHELFETINKKLHNN